MASIQLTSNGMYRVQVSKRGTRLSSTFETEEAANLWADQIEARIKNNSKKPDVAIRFAAAQSLLATTVPKRILDALASVPYTIGEVLEAAVPARDMVGIYFLIKNNDVVYVGQSGIDALYRIAKHRREGKDFDSYAFMHCKEEQLDEMERLYIAAFFPLLNFSFGRHRASVSHRPLADA